MKKIYNKNAREKALLEEAYSSIYERRNPDSGEWGGGMKGPFGAIQRGPKDEEEEDGGDAKVNAYKKFLHDFRRYSVAQDPVRPGEYGLTDEDVNRFRELGVQEDEEGGDNEDIDLTVDAGMSPQDKREAGEY
tara:strand:- start:55 stop:453 length:399 start_codon:yes stop_codon:yes gene_type:complete